MASRKKGINKRFTIKPGMSGAITTVLPIDRAKALAVSSVASLVAMVRTIFQQLHRRHRVEEVQAEDLVQPPGNGCDIDD